MNNLVTAIQTRILMGMQTGNVILDYIVGIIILGLLANISFDFKEWIITIKDYLIKKKRKSEYLIQGKVTTSTDVCLHYTNFPLEYKSVMFKLNNMGIDIKNAKQFNNRGRYDYDVFNSKVDNFSYSINTREEIKVCNDIYIMQDNIIDKSTDLKSSTETYSLYIYSYSLPFIKLKEIIDEWKTEYYLYQKEHNDGNYYYFTYIGKDKKAKDDNDEIKMVFESHIFKTNKTFANTIFEQKDEVVNRLNYFLNNPHRYKTLGIPYTLGFMFYGFPGCGKTSTIKAIANYTKRHIIEISLSKIKTCSELRKIFFNDSINGCYVPPNKKIIVLEDIDCMTNIIKKRVDNEIIMDTSKENVLESTLTGIIKGSMPRINDDDVLTLSYILNLIDGVLEQPGRILIITTNKPDAVDDALIRPGRIDMKVEFKKCTNNIIKDILKLYFNSDKVNNLKFDIPDYTYTQAEIFEMCFNINDIDAVYNNINNIKVIT